MTGRPGVVAVLLGEGRRLAERLGVEERDLERVRVLDVEDGMVHLRCRAVRSARGGTRPA